MAFVVAFYPTNSMFHYSSAHIMVDNIDGALSINLSLERGTFGWMMMILQNFFRFHSGSCVDTVLTLLLFLADMHFNGCIQAFTAFLETFFSLSSLAPLPAQQIEVIKSHSSPYITSTNNQRERKG